MRTATVSAGIPEKVKLALVRKGLTITRIALQIGKSKSTVSLVLRGKLRANETARRIAHILGLRVGDLPAWQSPYRNKQVHVAPAGHASEKGSRDALLFALNSPARCTPEDVDDLELRISSGALAIRRGNPLGSTKRRK